MKYIRNFVDFENCFFFSNLGPRASPDRAETPSKRCAMKKGSDFTDSRQNPCPGGLFYGHFLFLSHVRGLFSVEVDPDEVDEKSPVCGDLLLTTGG